VQGLKTMEQEPAGSMDGPSPPYDQDQMAQEGEEPPQTPFYELSGTGKRMSEMPNYFIRPPVYELPMEGKDTEPKVDEQVSSLGAGTDTSPVSPLSNGEGKMGGHSRHHSALD
jgi:hypothetical protein